MTFEAVLAPPLVANEERAARSRERWRRLTTQSTDASLAEIPAGGQGTAPLAAIMDGIFSGSPFLTGVALASPGIAERFTRDGANRTYDDLIAATESAAADHRTTLMKTLREIRKEVALLVALADLAGAWDLEQVTGALTRFADAAVSKAAEALVIEAVRRGDLVADTTVGTSGLIVLAMGKHGARELNYSSDIDLIVLFSPAMRYLGQESPLACAARFARGLEHILGHVTQAGYVFRVDLRLRPHLPGHPLAISTTDAELYYEHHGQNWERAALIKARCIVGEEPDGRRFLSHLTPFLWRRNLDFAAIRDIHSIKRQINAYRGFAAIKVLGHDIKVGRGGIREIEFFVQTQQLILGGQHVDLRTCGTVAALAALAESRWLDGNVSRELRSCYRFLRAVEHRLQMVADKQTQQLPQQEPAFAEFAAFAGFADSTAFLSTLQTCFEAVERHYAALFETEPDLGSGRSLVFTGTGDDSDTLTALKELGFETPASVSSRIRAWHHGHIRATRSPRARELLTELLPTILEALARQRHADQAFGLFDEFVSSLPAGVQLFSLFRTHPRLLGLMADLIGAAPHLARHLARHTDLFEAMLLPDFFEDLPGPTALKAELEAKLAAARHLDDALDRCLIWAQARQFQASLQVFLGLTGFASAASCLTAIAQSAIQALLERVLQAHREQNGVIDDGAFVVLGMGKLGAGELTFGSDLDLIFIFDAPEESRSRGARELSALDWFTRLSQRLMNALGTRTAGGRVFEIDTRLRPSGRMGPVACRLSNYAAYQAKTAEVWEQQAVTRARVVAGDERLARRVEEVIDATVRRQRAIPELQAAVHAMRMRIFAEHGSSSPWNLKHMRGGLVELEFVAQFLRLGHEWEHPALRSTRTAEVLERAGELGLIDRSLADLLIEALLVQQTIQTVLRLSHVKNFVPEEAPEGLQQALVRACARVPSSTPAGPGLPALEERLIRLQSTTVQTFEQLCRVAPDGVHGLSGQGKSG